MCNQARTFAGLGPVKASGQCDLGKTVRSRYIWYSVQKNGDGNFEVVAEFIRCKRNIVKLAMCYNDEQFLLAQREK